MPCSLGKPPRLFPAPPAPHALHALIKALTMALEFPAHTPPFSTALPDKAACSAHSASPTQVSHRPGSPGSYLSPRVSLLKGPKILTQSVLNEY